MSCGVLSKKYKLERKPLLSCLIMKKLEQQTIYFKDFDIDRRLFCKQLASIRIYRYRKKRIGLVNCPSFKVYSADLCKDKGNSNLLMRVPFFLFDQEYFPSEGEKVYFDCNTCYLTCKIMIVLITSKHENLFGTYPEIHTVERCQ